MPSLARNYGAQHDPDELAPGEHLADLQSAVDLDDDDWRSVVRLYRQTVQSEVIRMACRRILFGR